jgi:hypothetical protein
MSHGNTGRRVNGYRATMSPSRPLPPRPPSPLLEQHRRVQLAPTDVPCSASCPCKGESMASEAGKSRQSLGLTVLLRDLENQAKRQRAENGEPYTRSLLAREANIPTGTISDWFSGAHTSRDDDRLMRVVTILTGWAGLPAPDVRHWIGIRERDASFPASPTGVRWRPRTIPRSVSPSPTSTSTTGLFTCDLERKAFREYPINQRSNILDLTGVCRGSAGRPTGAR